MATINDRNIIQKLLTNNGCYMDDPQVAIIFSYTNDYSNPTQAIYYHSPNLNQWIQSFYDSPAIHDPSILWTASGGLTHSGAEWLESWLVDKLAEQTIQDLED